MKKKLSWWMTLLIIGVVGFGLIQLIPYGKDHTNPPVINEPVWDSAATKDLVTRGCYDCHSNETVWPWYSNVAPVSWLIQRDAEEGRSRLNFSEWPTNAKYQQGLMANAAEQISEGEMPPFQFLIIHKEAKFTAAEKQQLIQGLMNSISK